MAYQRKGRVCSYGGMCRRASQLCKPLRHGYFAVGQPLWIAEGPQAQLREVSDEIADIQRRVARGVEVEVQQIQARAAHDHLVRVEVAMDAARLSLGCVRAELIAGI